MRVTIDMIPYGFNNRITRETLISMTSQSDRAVRHQLSELAAKHPLCLSSHWKGVFRPLPSERDYVEICKAETLSRGKKTFNRIRAYKVFLDDDIQPSLTVKEVEHA